MVKGATIAPIDNNCPNSVYSTNGKVNFYSYLDTSMKSWIFPNHIRFSESQDIFLKLFINNTLFHRGNNALWIFLNYQSGSYSPNDYLSFFVFMRLYPSISFICTLLYIHMNKLSMILYSYFSLLNKSIHQLNLSFYHNIDIYTLPPFLNLSKMQPYISNLIKLKKLDAVRFNNNNPTYMNGLHIHQFSISHHHYQQKYHHQNHRI